MEIIELGIDDNTNTTITIHYFDQSIVYFTTSLNLALITSPPFLPANACWCLPFLLTLPVSASVFVQVPPRCCGGKSRSDVQSRSERRVCCSKPGAEVELSEGAHLTNNRRRAPSA